MTKLLAKLSKQEGDMTAAFDLSHVCHERGGAMTDQLEGWLLFGIRLKLKIPISDTLSNIMWTLEDHIRSQES